MPRKSATTTGTRLKTTDRRSGGTRRPLAGAVVAFGLFLGACSAPADGAPATTVPATPQTSTSAANSHEFDAGLAELRAALDRYGAGYEYVSEAWIGRERAIRVEGRRVGNATEQTITSGEGVVEHLTIGGDQWARTPGEEWEIVSESGPAGDPLVRLASPEMVTATLATATRTELEATYPAATFGLDGDALVVHLVVQDFELASASYETGDGSERATVETTFSPLADTSPITAP